MLLTSIEQKLFTLLNIGKCYQCTYPFTPASLTVVEEMEVFKIERFTCPNCHTTLLIPIATLMEEGKIRRRRSN